MQKMHTRLVVWILQVRLHSPEGLKPARNWFAYQHVSNPNTSHESILTPRSRSPITLASPSSRAVGARAVGAGAAASPSMADLYDLFCAQQSESGSEVGLGFLRES